MSWQPERARAQAGTGAIYHPSGTRTSSDLAAESALEIWAREKDLNARQEALLDEAVEETFPASDPIAPMRILGRVHPERHEQRHAASV
jgi:hypothetical protein